MMELALSDLLDDLLAGNALTREALEDLIRRHPKEGQVLEYKDGIVLAKDRTGAQRLVREGVSSLREWGRRGLHPRRF